MRALADYVLRTRTDEVPVSPPMREGQSTRVTMGFAAHDRNVVRHLAGQEALLVRNIQRPGEAFLRLRLVAVDPASLRLVAEVVGTRPPDPARPAEAARTSAAQPRRAGKAVLAAGAVLGLGVLVALGWTVHARADRSCRSSGECREGFACAAWGNPEYRSCERACRSDRDCPGSEVCVPGGADARVCRANR